METLAAGDELDSGDLRAPGVSGDAPFTIVAPLGECPHGARYVARQDDVPVMLTVVDPVLVAQPNLRATLTRELQKARGIAHRSFLPVHAFGRAGSSFVVVEADPGGGTIRQYVHARREAGQRLDVETAHTLVSHVCNALGALHEVMVHGYVTADTIHVSSDGRVSLSGAGLGTVLPQTRGFARLRDEGRLPNVAPEQLLTPPALVTGTDVYGVATVFIELVTGKPLPEAGCPLSELGLEGPDDLVECLERATAPSPMARPPDAATFKIELAEAIELGPLVLRDEHESVAELEPDEGRLPPPPPPLPRLDPDIGPPMTMPPHGPLGGYPPPGYPAAHPSGGHPAASGYPGHPPVAGGYPPGGYPPGGYPPGGYPPGGYPPGGYPPGNHPPGAYPPSGYPPGAYSHPSSPYGYPPYPHPPPPAGAPHGPPASPVQRQGQSDPSEALDALDAATRRLAEADADEIMDLTTDVDQSTAGLAVLDGEDVEAEASMLNLELGAFSDAAARLATLDGESAKEDDPQVSADEGESPSGEYFGSFSDPVESEDSDVPVAASPTARSARDLADIEPTDASDQRPLYFIVGDGKPRGPYSAFAIDRMIREGEVLRTHEIRHRSFDRLIAIGAIPAFDPALSARARQLDQKLLGEAGQRAQPKGPLRPPVPARRPRSAGTIVLVLLLLAGLGAAAWAYTQGLLG